jgi:hypothetical protein
MKTKDDQICFDFIKCLAKTDDEGNPNPFHDEAKAMELYHFHRELITAFMDAWEKAVEEGAVPALDTDWPIQLAS